MVSSGFQIPDGREHLATSLVSGFLSSLSNAEFRGKPAHGSRNFVLEFFVLEFKDAQGRHPGEAHETFEPGIAGPAAVEMDANQGRLTV